MAFDVEKMNLAKLREEIMSDPQRSQFKSKRDFNVHEIIVESEIICEKSSATKYTLWTENEVSFPTVKLMLIGETGKGKTTLINGILNFIMGITYNHVFRFTVPVNKSSDSKISVDSQTELITVYEIPYVDGMKYEKNLVIIDTPGIYDTRGTKSQKENLERIKKYLHNTDEKWYMFLCIVVEAHFSENGIGLVREIKEIISEIPDVRVLAIATFADKIKPTCFSVLENQGIKLYSQFKINNGILFRNSNSNYEEFREKWESWDRDYKVLLDYTSGTARRTELHTHLKQLDEAGQKRRFWASGIAEIHRSSSTVALPDFTSRKESVTTFWTSLTSVPLETHQSNFIHKTREVLEMEEKMRMCFNVIEYVERELKRHTSEGYQNAIEDASKEVNLDTKFSLMSKKYSFVETPQQVIDTTISPENAINKHLQTHKRSASNSQRSSKHNTLDIHNICLQAAESISSETYNVAEISPVPPMPTYKLSFDSHDSKSIQLTKKLFSQLSEDFESEIPDTNSRTLINLINEGADVKAKDSKGIQAIHLACKRGLLDVIELLESQGADILAKDEYFKTPLHWAALGNQRKVCQWLLDQGADRALTQRNKNGETPADVSRLKGYKELSNWLIKEESKFRLITAVLDNNERFVIDAFEDGADPESIDKNGNPILILAARSSSSEIVNLLIDHRASVDVTDGDGYQAIHRAAMHGRLEVLQKLAERGANIRVFNQQGRTPLHLAAYYDQKEICQWLLEMGVEPNITHESLKVDIPAVIAENRGHKSLALWLKEKTKIYLESAAGSTNIGAIVASSPKPSEGILSQSNYDNNNMLIVEPNSIKKSEPAYANEITIIMSNHNSDNISTLPTNTNEDSLNITNKDSDVISISPSYVDENSQSLSNKDSDNISTSQTNANKSSPSLSNKNSDFISMQSTNANESSLSLSSKASDDMSMSPTHANEGSTSLSNKEYDDISMLPTQAKDFVNVSSGPTHANENSKSLSDKDSNDLSSTTNHNDESSTRLFINNSNHDIALSHIQDTNDVTVAPTHAKDFDDIALPSAHSNESLMSFSDKDLGDIDMSTTNTNESSVSLDNKNSDDILMLPTHDNANSSNLSNDDYDDKSMSSTNANESSLSLFNKDSDDISALPNHTNVSSMNLSDKDFDDISMSSTRAIESITSLSNKDSDDISMSSTCASESLLNLSDKDSDVIVMPPTQDNEISLNLAANERSNSLSSIDHEDISISPTQANESSLSMANKISNIIALPTSNTIENSPNLSNKDCNGKSSPPKYAIKSSPNVSNKDFDFVFMSTNQGNETSPSLSSKDSEDKAMPQTHANVSSPSLSNQISDAISTSLTNADEISQSLSNKDSDEKTMVPTNANESLSHMPNQGSDYIVIPSINTNESSSIQSNQDLDNKATSLHFANGSSVSLSNHNSDAPNIHLSKSTISTTIILGKCNQGSEQIRLSLTNTSESPPSLPNEYSDKKKIQPTHRAERSSSLSNQESKNKRISSTHSTERTPKVFNQDKLNKTLLHAIENKNVARVKTALTKGADPNIIDKNGSPVLVTVALYSEELVRLLLEYEADVKATTNEGTSAVHRAAKRGYLDVLKILIGRGADIRVPDKKSMTPLHWAAFRNNRKACEWMLGHGASPDLKVKDNSGFTPADRAKLGSHSQLSLWLKQEDLKRRSYQKSKPGKHVQTKTSK